jgi:hypothetical protein
MNTEAGGIRADRPLRVYVSSTLLDLRSEREAVFSCLNDRGHVPRHSYVADSESVHISCLRDVEKCDLYILIVGHRYGEPPRENNPRNLSMTHLEFQHAGDMGIPRIALLRMSIPDENLSDIGRPLGLQRVMDFRDEVRRTVRCAEFTDATSFQRQLTAAVDNEIRKLVERNPGPSAAPTGTPADAPGLELLCDRARAEQGFEELLDRPDPRRPGCLIVFGEEDQAHPDFFERIQTHTLAGQKYRSLFPPETLSVHNLHEFYAHEAQIAPYILRCAGRELDGGAEIHTFQDLHRVLRRRRVALFLINCFVHVKNEQEARWWIAQFEALQDALSMNEAGPQILLSLAIDYPRVSWLLRRSRDLTQFFRRHYPDAFEGPDPGDGNGRVLRRLASASRVDVSQWCNQPSVRQRLSRGPIDRDWLLLPFNGHDRDVPMWHVLEHLRNVLRDHSA